MEQFPVTTRELRDTSFDFHTEGQKFLGNQISFLDSHEIDHAKEKALIREKNHGSRVTVEYNSYTKKFTSNAETVSPGEIIASRHFGFEVYQSNEKTDALQERTTWALYENRKTRDLFTEELNILLATALAKHTRRKYMFVSKAYEELSKREHGSEQLGVFAEKIMIALFERISIDRPDLGMSVSPANAYQDVHDKIDFILQSKNKKRGVNIEAQDTPTRIGIQFTVNTSKESHKKEQIQKAKEKGIMVDDILYIAIDQSMLRKALEIWKEDGKKITGPWNYLPVEARIATLRNTLGPLIDENALESLLKGEEQKK